ncbi:MAG: FecR domain-containing protein [Nitrospira sp.]
MQGAYFDMIDPRSPDDALVDQAIAWLLRLQSDDATDADRERFAAWYAESNAHRVAFLEAKDFTSRLRRPAQDMWDKEFLGRTSGERALLKQWLPAMALSAVLVAVVALLWGTLPFQSSGVITTAKGEHRRVDLPDGSTVILNANSAVRVAYSDQRRDIELQSGEASFVVAKDPQRPFEVHAGEGITRAIGTEFNVRLRPSITMVTVVEGIVQVVQRTTDRSFSQERTAAAVEVRPNQAVSYSRIHGIGAVQKTDLLSSLAWQRGQLVFNQKPLAEVIEELNQQWEGHIFVAGDQLRTLSVNGVFDIHDTPAVVQAIERTFHVRSVTLPFDIVVLY